MNALNFEFQKTVTKKDIDNLHHVNNVVYVSWVQEAANKHWALLTNSFIDDKYVWVVLRHEIDYYQAAFLNDTLSIKTWVGTSSGVKSERFVEIKRNGELLTKAKTIWCLLDKKTLKPTRIPEEIKTILTFKK
jgi:acyl-CoA thioester hydrolase